MPPSIPYSRLKRETIFGVTGSPVYCLISHKILSHEVKKRMAAVILLRSLIPIALALGHTFIIRQ